jgi:rfaE bifunctional protein, domain I/rfaE bifunctional protein, domain II
MMKSLFTPNPSAHVLVAGDVILDRYVYGDTTRISPEAPVPVVLVKHTEERPGGAGNVALNIAHLGIQVSLVGLTGQDSSADLLVQVLSAAGVKCKFLKQEGFPTITKLRVLSQHQQLLRLDYEASSAMDTAGGLPAIFKDTIENTDIVVLSDYAKGSLKNVRTFITECKARGVKVLVDPKGDDFTRYQGASLLTPNLREFETVVGRCTGDDSLVEKGHKLCATLGLDALLITKGEHGMTLIRAGDGPVHLTTEAREVFDVTGAGDTVIATMAAALASGYDYAEAMVFANRAAGLVVAKLGAASVSVEELNSAASLGEHGMDAGIIDEPGLLQLIRKVRSRGETIVMTNGCFDVLHAGHVHYLKQARQFGDYLIVAVNDDDSVRRLKGQGRPVNPLGQRMAVLNALKYVDWIIAFSEDTPERLVRTIQPDVLVKGGDYKPEEIAGGEFVKKNGGKIEIIPLYGDYSTTSILNAGRSGDSKRS